MPSPAFSVARRLEQSLDDLLKCFRRRQRIADKLRDLFRRRRQPRQVERRATNQRRTVCLRRGLDRLFVQLLQNESVNRRLNALPVSNRRNFVKLHGFESPDVIFGVCPLRFGDRRGGLFPPFDPWRASVNPLLERGDQIIGQWTAGRHLLKPVTAEQGQIQQTLFRVAGNEGRASLTTFERGLPRAQVEPGGGGFAVTGPAFRRKRRRDPLDEELFGLRERRPLFVPPSRVNRREAVQTN